MRQSIVTTSADRLFALKAMGMDHPKPDREYDDAVQIAATIFGTPIAQVRMVDPERQWVEGRSGVRKSVVDHASVFCNYVVETGKPLLVEDATKDERFADHPSVTHGAHLRFFAGAPLMIGDEVIGAVCAIDTVPRVVDSRKLNGLLALGRQLSDLLGQRCLSAQMAIRARHQLEDIEAAEQTTTIHCQSARRFETLFNGIPIACFTFDQHGVIREWNLEAERSFGLSAGDASDSNIFDVLVGAKRTAKAIEVINRVLGGDTVNSFEWVYRRPDGGVRRLFSSIFPLQGAGGQVVGGVAATSDLTAWKLQERQLRATNSQLEAANVRLEQLASRDALTGVANYRAFCEQLDEAFAVALRHNEALSLLILDVDRFKSLNDSFGHPAGDEALKQLGLTLLKVSRLGDFVARYGGEEFAILLPKTSAQKARQVAERVRKAIANSTWRHGHITVSVGCASLCADIQTPQDLVVRADRALYQSKHEGRDRVTSFENLS